MAATEARKKMTKVPSRTSPMDFGSSATLNGANHLTWASAGPGKVHATEVMLHAMSCNGSTRIILPILFCQVCTLLNDGRLTRLDRHINSTRMATLRFHIVPNAKQNQVMGEHGDAITIKLRAPAVEGKANAALRSFLAEELKLPERNIALKRGKKSREKTIRIDSLSEEEVRSRL